MFIGLEFQEIYLMKLCSGILTGSVYNLNINSTLKRSGFPGEGTADGTVLVIKTHNAPKTDRKFDKCVMIYRNPKDAVLAEYKRKLTNHTGDLPKNIAVLGGKNMGWKRDIIRVDGVMSGRVFYLQGASRKYDRWEYIRLLNTYLLPYIISLKCVSKAPLYNMSSLVQVMTWGPIY